MVRDLLWEERTDSGFWAQIGSELATGAGLKTQLFMVKGRPGQCISSLFSPTVSAFGTV